MRGKRHLCTASALLPGEALAFDGVVRGELRPCFAIRLPESRSGPDRFAAYLNVCAHRNQPVVVNRQPFDEDLLLECRAHGARYEPESGLCVDGPCIGAHLVPVTVENLHGELYAVDDDTVDDSIYEE